MESLLLSCRAGLEADCAAEIIERAAAAGVGGYCRAEPDSGYLRFVAPEPGTLSTVAALDFGSFVFPRQWMTLLAELTELPETDRAGAIAAVAAGLGRVGDVWLEYPDTNEGKSLSGFCRKFERPLRQALQAAGLRIGKYPELPRLQLFFLNSRHVFVGTALPGNSAPWPLGVPRLRMPAQAPSRSTLKLEEALLVFLDEDERARRLQPGMRAVDLGAAPGGWTWQLVRRGLQVTAVDNGPMAAELMDSGLVEHLRADGFTYRPAKTVDWLVCDMVEQPHRIAGLVGDWFGQRLCREAIFNLKLPMKKRWQTVKECLETVERRGGALRLRARQLYHDREEVTVYARRP